MPSGFHRIRHYGLFANANRAENIATDRVFYALTAGVGCTRRLGERSFRSTDAMTDNSRKLARRRAGVSVVSSTFSIRRDRRSASALSIARHSRSSISSFKSPRAFGVYFGLPGNLVSDVARCGLFTPANLLLSRAKFGDASGGSDPRVGSCWCGERFPVARHRRQVSDPALESMVEEADPSWCAPDARLDPVYPRLGGQVREPSAAEPSEVPLAIARDQVDEQIGQDSAASNRPASRGLRICAWGRHAVAC